MLVKIIGVLTALLLITVIISNKYLTVTNYEIESDNLPPNFNGYKIALISDLHNSEFGKNNKTLLRKLEKENPDTVLLAGDMVSTSDTDYSVFFDLAENLAKSYDTYYITGNHEQAIGERELNLFCQNIESKGITVLDNQMVTLQKKEQKLNLYGMWFNLRFYADRSPNSAAENQYYFDTHTMNEVLGKETEGFNILLTHSPIYFETYSKWGADLVLSGHMHGGMIRLPFWGGIYSPEKTFFPTYDAGVFEKEGSKMVVSRGMGNGDLGFRFLNCPELVIVNLKAPSK
jgi:predicted MPP superfamily phosphohydrolase